MRDPYFGKPNSKKSNTRYYIDRRKPLNDLYDSLYSSTFIEDLHLAIMPIGGKSKNPDFSVKLSPSSNEIENLVRFGIPTQHGYTSNMTEAVCDFINEAVHILALYGKSYYEIVYIYTDKSKKKIEGFKIEKIPPYNIINILGNYCQYLPKRINEPIKEEVKRFIWLDKKNILAMSIPKEICSYRKFKEIIYKLKTLGKYVYPKFAAKDMKELKQSKYFDSSLYFDNKYVFLAKITKPIGWISRMKFTEKTLEFYQIYRYLKFERTKAILRNYVINRLNDALEIIGQKMDFKAKIEIEGIPTPKDFNNHIRQLIEGKLQFTEAVKLAKIN